MNSLIRVVGLAQLCLLLLACTPEAHDLALPRDCFQDLRLKINFTMSYGEWRYTRVPGTTFYMCLPDNRTVVTEDTRSGYHFFAEHPQWRTAAEIWVPNSTASEWLLDEFPDQNPSLYVTVIPTEDRWDGSLEDWIVSAFGGKPTTTSDNCIVARKTTKDFPEPHFVEFLGPAIELQFVRGGRGMRFAACKEAGALNAVLLDGQVVLFGYPHGFRPDHVADIELMDALIRTIKVLN